MSSEIYGVPEENLIPKAAEVVPNALVNNQVVINRDANTPNLGSPADRLRSLISSQPDKATADLFDKEAIQTAERTAEDFIKSPTYDLTTNPDIAAYASLQQLNAEITKAIVTVAPQDFEATITNAPPLDFTEGTDGKPKPATAESLTSRTEYLREQAIGIITKARENGATLPKYDSDSGDKLPENSIPVLKAAVEFLKPKSSSKDFSEIAPILAMAVKNQGNPDKAQKWGPGGLMFEAAVAQFIGTGPGELSRDDIIAYFNRMKQDSIANNP